MRYARRRVFQELRPIFLDKRVQLVAFLDEPANLFELVVGEVIDLEAWWHLPHSVPLPATDNMTAAPFKPSLTGMAVTLIDVPLYPGGTCVKRPRRANPRGRFFSALGTPRHACELVMRSLAPAHPAASS